MAQIQSTNSSSNNNNTTSKTSVIAAGTVITGDFTTNENLRIDGAINGDVKCEKKLVIGKNGSVNGKITAAEYNINGQINGQIVSQGIITLGATSSTEGKITASALIMDEGAIFNGEFVIGKDKKRNA